jgi:hypothetical protein
MKNQLAEYRLKETERKEKFIQRQKEKQKKEKEVAERLLIFEEKEKEIEERLLIFKKENDLLRAEIARLKNK